MEQEFAVYQSAVYASPSMPGARDLATAHHANAMERMVRMGMGTMSDEMGMDRIALQ